MTEDVRRVPFRKKPMGEKFQLVFFGHPEKRRGDKIALSKWGFSWSVFFMFAAILVAGFLCCGCVTTARYKWDVRGAESVGYMRGLNDALGLFEAGKRRGLAERRDESMDALGDKAAKETNRELDCQGGR